MLSRRAAQFAAAAFAAQCLRTPTRFYRPTPVTLNAAPTLADRMGKCDMFCFQCEQTLKNKGCTRVGVCGKTPRVSALQDLTVQALKVLGFYLYELRQLGAPPHTAADRYILHATFATLTNVNNDEARFVTILERLRELTADAAKEYAAQCKAKGQAPKTLDKMVLLPEKLPGVDGLVDLGRTVGVLTRFTKVETQNQAAVAEMLMYALKGLTAYTEHSLPAGNEDAAIYEYIERALHWFLTPDVNDLGKGVGMCLELGKFNVDAMGMLYKSNTRFGVPTPTAVPVKPVPGKCVLVSGHDLFMTKALLEACEPHGINVYTHGELLPAHAYPELKKHKNFVGHFGGAWMRQGVEFPHFPGAIFLTTNCLTEPKITYKDRVFTSSCVGWPGVTHIGDSLAELQFDKVIKCALASPGFTDKDKEFAYPVPEGLSRPDKLTVGFGHETVLSVAPTILEQIQKGNITRFFLVGGCDGYEGERSYYTELVEKLPKTAVVLTLGCGKYRLNHLDLGTIGDTGIPRILDMGQCNDSFSAVQVAVALAGALKCEVKDLPLSIVLSWFEQKAVAVLMSLLHLGLKPIYIGPSLPAFITPDVAAVLVKDFGIRPCTKPDADLKQMLEAKGMGA